MRQSSARRKAEDRRKRRIEKDTHHLFQRFSIAGGIIQRRTGDNRCEFLVQRFASFKQMILRHETTELRQITFGLVLLILDGLQRGAAARRRGSAED